MLVYRSLRTLVVGFTLLCACVTTTLSAQQAVGLGIELVEEWIRGKVSAERAWKRDLSTSGIAFQIDAETEARLRRVGAGDDWIDVLRRARYSPPATTPPNNPSASPTTTAPKRRFSRDQLRPIYFGSEARITPYVGILRMRETGGTVAGQSMQTSRGLARLKSTSLPELSKTYGLAVDYLAVGIDLEVLAEHDVTMLNLGVKYSPFLPLGTSGLRFIISAKPFAGMTKQTLAHFPKQDTDTYDPDVAIVNYTYGGEVSSGLAFHWKPGAWVFGDVTYRLTSTFSRELQAPDQPNITDGIPWSKWAGRGAMLRFGVGF